MSVLIPDTVIPYTLLPWGSNRFAPLLWSRRDSTPVSYPLAVQKPRPCMITVNQVCIQKHGVVSVPHERWSTRLPVCSDMSFLFCCFWKLPRFTEWEFTTLQFFAMCETGLIRKPFALTVANLHAKCSHSLSNTDDILPGCVFAASVDTAHLRSLSIRQRHPFACLISST